VLKFFNFSLKNLRMDNILDINDKFDFDTLNLENPMPMQGGNFFTKINYSNKMLPLFIQLPKCNSKNGIIKNNTSKKSHIDLLFNYFDSNILSWFESLENKCRELIYNKKDEWFNSEMELDDIESMFLSSLKSFKSGKFIVLRANIPSSKNIKKEYCMIYDENEMILTSDKVTEDKELIPLISIDGIKFSSKSFQLEINIPQIMILNLENTIKKDFMIKRKENTLEDNSTYKNSITEQSKKTSPLESVENNSENHVNHENDSQNHVNHENNSENHVNHENNSANHENNSANHENNSENHVNHENNLNHENDENHENHENDTENQDTKVKTENKEQKDLEEKDLEEISDLDLNIDNLDEISLKNPEDIYIEIYTSARNKAKQMKKAAIDAYFHAKNIKSKYGITENYSSDDEMENFQ
tara:strand:+ start:12439 stop:13686 length:1248 start_codon:yes stop_codon:yes gene_type:complete